MLTFRKHPCTEVLSRCSSEAGVTPLQSSMTSFLRLAS
jgi:hypothetical protein